MYVYTGIHAVYVVTHMHKHTMQAKQYRYSYSYISVLHFIVGSSLTPLDVASYCMAHKIILTNLLSSVTTS